MKFKNTNVHLTGNNDSHNRLHLNDYIHTPWHVNATILYLKEYHGT